MSAHRTRLAPSVRAALKLLDRVEEGQPVSPRAIDLALHATGDIGWHHETHAQSVKNAESKKRAYARMHDLAQRETGA